MRAVPEAGRLSRPRLRQPRVSPTIPTPIQDACRSSTIALAEANDRAAARPTWEPVVRKQDRERWNDWGIGMLLQGDLKGAEYAFTRVTEAEPEYADGWLNVARALIQEGETDAARSRSREGAGDRSRTLAASISSRRWCRKPMATTMARLPVLRDSRAPVSARPRRAEPDRPHSVSEARVYARPSRPASASASRSRRRAGPLHADALPIAAWADARRRSASRSCSCASRRRIVAGDHRQAAHDEPRRQQ